MHRLWRTALILSLAVAFTMPTLAQQQADPDSPRYKGVVALNEFMQSDGDEAIAVFIETRIAGSVRESMDDEMLAETLAAMRAEATGATMQGARPVGELSAEIILDPGDGTEISISFELDPQDNDRFTSIRTPEHSIG